MGINPKSPLENGLELSQMTRKDQRQELTIVKAELQEKLERAQSLQANNLIAVADRKQRAFKLLDEFDELLGGYQERLKRWMESQHDTSIPAGDGNLKKNDDYTMEMKEKRLAGFQQMLLRREIINNELSKMPSMPDMPQVGVTAPTQINQQLNITVDASGQKGYDATSDLEAFKKAKETDGG